MIASQMGSIGDALNTEGATPAQIAQLLGLDYEGSPHIEADPTRPGMNRAREDIGVFIVEAVVTTQMQENLTIPVHQSVYDRMQALAERDPSFAEVFGRMSPQAIGRAHTGLDASSNPWRATGGTAVGSTMDAGSTTATNQEQYASWSDRVNLPAGSRIYYTDPSGRQHLVATYVQNHSGERSWEIASSCPPEAAARVTALRR